MGHLWLRSESKKFETRTPLIPQHAQLLIQSGHTVTVEESTQRIFSIEEYQQAGCTIVPAGAWETAPHDAYILGLKNLPESPQLLKHKHIYFAHSFKGQLHAEWLLRRFRKGGGFLYDLEYLTDINGKRVASFGLYAGVVGTGIALLVWALRKSGKKSPFKIPNLYLSQTEMIKDIHTLFHSLNVKPSILVIGAKGRSGSGACYLLKQLGLDFTQWGRKHTQNNHFHNEILKFDILINCVFVDKTTPCFLTAKQLEQTKKLSVISDISCEAESKYNPLPFYTETNSFENPAQSISDVELISIDNLPSYLPVDSSISFSEQLINHLSDLLAGNLHNPVWNAAANSYRENSMKYIIEKTFRNSPLPKEESLVMEKMEMQN